MKYKVLEEISLQYLEIEVNKYITDGWRPQGGISAARAKYSGGNNEIIFCQAMIKD
jgi:hypothetical protein